MTTHPLIGVVPLVDSNLESLWMVPSYFERTSALQGIPVMLPLTTDEQLIDALIEKIDGLLLTGGHDLDAMSYGQTTLVDRGLCCEVAPKRDEMERILIHKALECDLPILGVCRGLQALNAYCGGSLWQDLPAQHPSTVDHHPLPGHRGPAHEVCVLPHTPLFELVGSKGDAAECRCFVNSWHHQGIKTLAPGFKAMAVADDGLVEALYRPESTFVWAVQWHPELDGAEECVSQKVFLSFVEAAATFMSQR